MTTKNVRFQGLVKTTAEIESDKFAGRIGWNTTLARFVAYYNSTQYAQMARRDVLETFAAGLEDSTLGVGLPMFAGTAGRLSTESVANFRSRIGAQAKLTNPVTGTGAAGRIAYWSSASQIASSGSLTYDGTILQSGGAGPDIYGIIGSNRFAGNIDSASFTAPSFDGNLIGWNRAAGSRRTDFVSSVANPNHYHGFEWWSSKAGAFTSLAILRETGALTLKNLVGTGNRLTQSSSDGTLSATIPVPTAYIQTLLDDADAAAARATLGAGTSNLALGETSSTAYRGDRGKTSYDHSQLTASNPHGTTYAQLASIPAALDAIDGLTPAADRIPYYTGANSASLAPLSAFGRSLIDDADQATARATLGAAKDNRIMVQDFAAISATTTNTILNSIALASFCGSGRSVKLSYSFIANDPLTQPIITLKYAGVTIFAIGITGNISSIVLDMAYFPGPIGNIHFWGVVVNDETPTYINTHVANVPANGAGTLELSCKTTSGATVVSAAGSILEF